MLGKSTDASLQSTDSFYDDQDEQNPSTTPFISSIRIVTSKPPVYRRQSESSSSPSPSSCSDRDVTDVSSMGGENHRMHQEKSSDHPFHLQSMRHVLLGSSAPTSRPPSPVHPTSLDMTKKHVRIVTSENEKPPRQRSQHRNQHNQPYIHGHHQRNSQRIRLTSSAINRQKQQQRIERENLKILERLQQTRATRGLQRDVLLSHYDRQIGYVSYPTVPPPPSTMTTTTTTTTGSRLPKRPSSASNFNSTFTTSEKMLSDDKSTRPSSASHLLANTSVRSRPVSAPTSINGSSRSSSARRPVWNDRWQSNQE